MKTQKPGSTLDRAPFSTLTRNWNRARIDGYFDKIKRHDGAIPPAVSNSLQTIDAKATGLLTHTSMMIAGLGLIAPLVVDDQIEIGIVISEVACYVLIAIGCLSISRSENFWASATNKRELINHELILRRELYAWCNRAAIALTIAVFAGCRSCFSGRRGNSP